MHQFLHFSNLKTISFFTSMSIAVSTTFNRKTKKYGQIYCKSPMSSVKSISKSLLEKSVTAIICETGNGMIKHCAKIAKSNHIKKLFETWLKDEKICSVIPLRKDNSKNLFAIEQHADSWKSYHIKHAKLQWLSRAENRSKQPKQPKKTDWSFLFPSPLATILLVFWNTDYFNDDIRELKTYYAVPDSEQTQLCIAAMEDYIRKIVWLNYDPSLPLSNFDSDVRHWTLGENDFWPDTAQVTQ